jgi:small conductance mechanosensitive channel
VRSLQRLNHLAARLLASPGLEDGPRQTLQTLLDQGQNFAVQRERRLETRAAQEREQFDKFAQSPQADIARAFIEDLNDLRKDYVETLLGQLEIRRSIGLETESLLQVLRQRVTMLLESLAGQVALDAMSIQALRERLAEDPLDEDLAQALGLVQTKQNANLDHFDRVIDLAERMGLPVAEQRSLLIRERGAIGVELLQRDVFNVLWRDEFEQLRHSLVRQGPDLLFRFMLFALILVVAWVVARLVRGVVRLAASHRRFGLSVLVRDTLIALSGVAVMSAGVVVALAAVGVSLGPIVAGIGVLGILVGLAVQDSLGNLAAGAMILVHRPFDVDDHIQVAGANGIVKRMNWLATTINTFDNQVLVVPNRRIWGDTIVNFTASHVRRVDIKVNFSYSEDVDRVHAVLADILEQHEAVLAKPEPQIHVVGMEESAMAIVIKPWVRTEAYWSTLWELNRLIKKRFDAEGIEIPFPQRVVTLLSPEGRSVSVPEPGNSSPGSDDGPRT